MTDLSCAGRTILSVGKQGLYLPAAVLARAGVSPGDQLRIRVSGNKISLKKESPPRRAHGGKGGK